MLQSNFRNVLLQNLSCNWWNSNLWEKGEFADNTIFVGLIWDGGESAAHRQEMHWWEAWWVIQPQQPETVYT